MLPLLPNDQLGAKQDAGNDVIAHVRGVKVTDSSGVEVGIGSADGLLLSTTAAALVATPASTEHHVISSIKFVNPAAGSLRAITVYLETDATPEWAAANIWHILLLAPGEFAEWTGGGGWDTYDANGVKKFASASWPTIPEGVTPPTPPAGYVRPFATTLGRMSQVDDQGIVAGFIEDARHVNYVINGEFDYFQRQVAATATTYSNTSGRTYGADRFGVTNENASVTIARVDTGSAPETGLQSRYYAKIDKITAAGKIVYSQVFESQNCLHLRGRTIRVQVKLKANAALTFRLGLLQLAAAGTIDTIPATFVSAFGGTSTDPTFGTNLAKIAPVAGQADNGTIVNNAVDVALTTAWQRFGAVFTLPTDFKNLVLVVWSNAQVATTDDFSISEVGLYDGPEIRDWTPRPQSDQYINCARYYNKSFALDVAPAQNAGLVGAVRGNVALGGAVSSPHLTIALPVRMRANPTVTLFNPSAANAFLRQIVTPSDATATSSTSANDRCIDVTATGLAAWAVGQGVVIHYTADAEL